MKQILLLCSFSAIVLLIVSVVQMHALYDQKLHVIFCNVGQGDSILVKTPDNYFILLDSGPDDSVLGCLSSHMPFWVKTIHVGLLSHPHADHLNGFNKILYLYSMNSFVSEDIRNSTSGFKTLQSELTKNNIPIHLAYAGDKLTTPDGITISIVGPTQEFLAQTSPNKLIGESKEFGSLITLVSYKNFRVLLTGDSQADELESATEAISTHVDVFQVPHHGSKTGMNENILNRLSPQAAVISVGKNRYGHPTPIALGLLKEFGIPVLRTDQYGDIEFISDGQSWGLKKSH